MVSLDNKFLVLLSSGCVLACQGEPTACLPVVTEVID